MLMETQTDFEVEVMVMSDSKAGLQRRSGLVGNT